jgi:hypothetical protein
MPGGKVDHAIVTAACTRARRLSTGYPAPWQAHGASLAPIPRAAHAMNLVDRVSHTLFYPAQDGRIVFRPWGRRGPVYLLTEAQRRTRSRIHLGFHAACVVAIPWSDPASLSAAACAIAFAGFLAASYLLHWLYSLGLPRTTVPPTPSPEYTQRLLGRLVTRRQAAFFGALFAAAAALFVWEALAKGPSLANVALAGVSLAFVAGFVRLWRMTAPGTRRED